MNEWSSTALVQLLDTVAFTLKTRFRVGIVQIWLQQGDKPHLFASAGMDAGQPAQEETLQPPLKARSAPATVHEPANDHLQVCDFVNGSDEELQFYTTTPLPGASGRPTVGTLCMLAQTPVDFSPADRLLFEAIGVAIGAIINHLSHPDQTDTIALNTRKSMLVLDAEHNAIAVNARFTQLTGLVSADLQSTVTDHLLCLDRPHAGALLLRHALLAELSACGMTRCRTKNGGTVPVETFIFPVLDVNGAACKILILMAPQFSGSIDDFLLSLRESERTELLAQHIDGLWATDAEGRVTELSGKPMAHGHDITHDRFWGRRFDDIELFDCTSTDWTAFYSAVAKQDKPPDIECCVRRHNEFFWYRMRGFRQRSSTGLAPRYHGSFKDITDAKQAQQMLLDSERKFKQLTALSSDWYWVQDADYKFVEIGEQLHTLRGLGPQQFIGKTRWDVASNKVSETVWEAHKSLLRARQEFRDFEIESRDASGNVFWEAISGTPRFNSTGEFIGYHGIGRDITERKVQQKALHESQERLALVLEGSTDGAWDIDPCANTAYLSPAGWQMLGREPGDLQFDKSTRLQLTHPSDTAKMDAAIHRVFRGQEDAFSVELRMLHSQGHTVPVLNRGRAVRNASGRVVRMSGTMTDQTQQRQSQAHIRLLESCVQSLQDVVLITHASPSHHPGPIIAFVNEAFERFTGYTREEVIGKTPRLLQGPLTSRIQLDRIAEALRLWQPVRAELANYKKNGEVHWIELEITPVATGGDGWFTHWVGVQRDVTPRKQAEHALAKTANHLSMVLQASNLGTWVTDLKTGTAQKDLRWFSMLGYEPGQISDAADSWLTLVHPEDTDTLVAYESNAVHSDNPFASEFRMLHKDGTWRWIQSHGKVIVRDDAGRPVTVAGTHRDITENVHAQLLAARQQTQLVQCLQAMPVGVLVSQAGIIRFANLAMFEMLDITSPELPAHWEFKELVEEADQCTLSGRGDLVHAEQEVPSLWLNFKRLDGTGFRALLHCTLLEWNDEKHILHTVSQVGDENLLASEVASVKSRYERLLVNQLEERQAQIARELHDSLGSQLTGISLQAAAIKIQNTQNQPLASDIERLLTNVKAAAELTRGLARGLVPVDTWPSSFWRALERLCGEYDGVGGLACEFDVQGDFDAVSADVGNNLYRICQEAITNALRHGAATEINVSLHRSGFNASLTIADNGSGFDTALASVHTTNGLGLSSMFARARAIDAKVSFKTVVPSGTCVTVEWPFVPQTR